MIIKVFADTICGWCFIGQTKSDAYSMKKVSFEENKTFNKSNVERFINFHKKKLRS